jgi:hypothetical protein
MAHRWVQGKPAFPKLSSKSMSWPKYHNGKDDLLASIRNVQASRPNLVIYSRLIGGTAELAWWVSSISFNMCLSESKIFLAVHRVLKSDGMRLKATGFKEWLRARGLFLEYLCPLVMEIDERTPCSCRLVVSKTTGDVLAFCHQEENGCGMRGKPWKVVDLRI